MIIGPFLALPKMLNMCSFYFFQPYPGVALTSRFESIVSVVVSNDCDTSFRDYRPNPYVWLTRRKYYSTWNLFGR